jgi:hypothetical protein
MSDEWLINVQNFSCCVKNLKDELNFTTYRICCVLYAFKQIQPTCLFQHLLSLSLGTNLRYTNVDIIFKQRAF